MEKFKKDYLNKQFIFAVILTSISAFIMAVGVKVFISPNKFLSTGATGIAIIFGRLYDNMTHGSMETTITGIVLFLLNIPLFILSWKKLSHKFAILTAVNVPIPSYGKILVMVTGNIVSKIPKTMYIKKYTPKKTKTLPVITINGIKNPTVVANITITSGVFLFLNNATYIKLEIIIPA